MAMTKPSSSQVTYSGTTVNKVLEKSILSYDNYSAAQAAAATLSDGHVVEVIGAAETYSVSSGVLTQQQFDVRLGHTATVDGFAKRSFDGVFPASHVGDILSGFNVQMKANGSGQTGPNNADYGATIAIHKAGYAGSNPLAGEIDGLSITVRQDGPKGTSAGDPGSSDAGGILVNVQNVDDAGFLGVMEATASNYDSATGTIPRSIQIQLGILDMNQSGKPGYGFVAVSSRGVNDHAFYAANGSQNGGTWNNAFYVPGSFRIDMSGNLYGPTGDWATGGWSLVRGAGANGATTLTHRGTGAMFFMAQEATSIIFGTNNAARFEVTSTGTFRPTSGNVGAAIGDPNRRVVPYCQSLNIGSTSTNGVNILAGDGSPEGVVSAPVGSLYLRRDGGVGTTLYVKQSGTAATGWAAK